MSNELTVGSIGDVIRERVRKVVMDSLPEDQLDKLFQNEFDAFFKPQFQRDYYGKIIHDKPELPSQFSTLIQKEIQSVLLAKIQKTVNEKLSTYESVYDSESGMTMLMGDLVTKLAPVLLQSLAKDFVSLILERVKQST